MEYGAIDLHLRHSQIRIVGVDGTVVLDRRIDTTRAEFDAVFGGRAPMRILLESGTESEWVAQRLEALGHEVIVADPNYAPMYGSRSRKVKTDRPRCGGAGRGESPRDLSRAHRVVGGAAGAAAAAARARQLVRMRSGRINLLRALLRQEGWRLPSGRRRSDATRASSARDAAGAGRSSWRRCGRGSPAQSAFAHAGDAAVAAQAAADPIVRAVDDGAGGRAGGRR